MCDAEMAEALTKLLSPFMASPGQPLRPTHTAAQRWGSCLYPGQDWISYTFVPPSTRPPHPSPPTPSGTLSSVLSHHIAVIGCLPHILRCSGAASHMKLPHRQFLARGWTAGITIESCCIGPIDARRWADHDVVGMLQHKPR